MNPLDRARAYVEKCPPAITGQAGHATTFEVACALTHGFCLQDGDAWNILLDYNGRCSPPWSESELRHKLTSAQSVQNHAKPRGHLLHAGGHQTSQPYAAPSTPSSAPARPVAPIVAPARYDLTGLELPEPVDDGARALIRTLFRPGESIRIVAATLNGDDKEVPNGDGSTFTREEWLKRLDRVEGDPNRIFSSTDRTGIYIALNPLKPGGTRDADVTDYRHALIEFDERLTPEEQFDLYQKSNLPCAAVIYSGGKSVHAWVKVNARDRVEYDERVSILHAHFSAHSPDVKNKNPSRLSRLPACVRFDRRQELLALNVGAESFSAWLEKVQGHTTDEVTVAQLDEFDPAKDAACLVGDRWLCRGGSCLLIGPSGVGKSSLAIQFAIAWAVGRPMFGIMPTRPLKILIIQAENDMGDLAEMVRGVRKSMGITPESFDDVYTTLNRNLIFVTDTTHSGPAFVSEVARVIEKHKPDMVMPDPLLSFIGDDISRQSVCSAFLRSGLAPISKVTGVTWFMVHHTGKTSADPRAKKHWQTSDHSYAGIGSSELVNWARATMVLEQAGTDGLFRLILSKRGKRAGAVHPCNDPATTLWVRHSTDRIYWEPLDPPSEEKPSDHVDIELDKKKGRPKKVNVTTMVIPGFFAGCKTDGEGLNEISERLQLYLIKNHGMVDEEGKSTVSVSTLKRNMPTFVALGKLKKENGLYKAI